MIPDHRYLDDLTKTSTRIEPALVVDDPDAEQWHEDCDMMVIGIGLAGTSATLRAAEHRGLDIIAVDRAMGGGASAISGGVLYVGGSTKVQQEAGVVDTPEAMADYLLYETGDVVREDTLRRFARASASFLPWLESHGARFGGPLTLAKTSYPGTDFLYFSGNENTPAARALAPPAPRGHRVKPPHDRPATALSGADLLAPILASIDAQPNVRFFRQTVATRMIVDRAGAVVGVELSRVPPSSLAAVRHRLFHALGKKTILAMLGLLAPVQRAATKVERKTAGLSASASGAASSSRRAASCSITRCCSMPPPPTHASCRSARSGTTVRASSSGRPSAR